MDKQANIEQEKRERYLKGELQGTELDQFTLRLMRDKKLQQDLNADRLLYKTLWKQSKPEPVGKAPRSASLNRALLILAVGLFLVLMWFLLFPTSKTPAGEEQLDLVPPSTTESPIEETVPNTTNPTAPNVPEDAEAAPEDDPSPKQNTTTISRPIAANFEVNPVLENYLSNKRGAELQLESPDPNATFKYQDSGLSFPIKGILSAAPEQLICHIFSNKEEDYEAFSPLQTLEITPQTVEGKPAFQQNIAIQLNPGLYYYILEDEDGTLLYTGKFVVRR